MLENADLYRTNWPKRYFDALSCFLYLIYIHMENRRTFLPQIIDGFSAVWSYGKLSAKFLESSVEVIDTVGFCRFS